MSGGGDSLLAVLLTGPYGAGIKVKDVASAKNMLTIAGSTGISFVFPQVLQQLAKNVGDRDGGIIQLVWIVRKRADIQWFLPEMEGLKESIVDHARSKKRKSTHVRTG